MILFFIFLIKINQNKRHLIVMKAGKKLDDEEKKIVLIRIERETECEIDQNQGTSMRKEMDKKSP